jgi:hypothetical protein
VELTETKAELQRLRERVSVGARAIQKDLSLISLVPKWSGLESGTSLEEFLSSIEVAARVGMWEDSDRIQVVILRLSDVAKQSYNGCLEFNTEDVTWQKFKDVFRRRFCETHTDQYNFMRLQTAMQRWNEYPQEFTDRCRALSQKIVCKVDGPVAQRIHYENADRMLMARFVALLTGVPGRQVRYSNPLTLNQALKIALSVQEAERQEKFSESFYTSFKNSLKLRSPSSSHHAG